MYTYISICVYIYIYIYIHTYTVGSLILADGPAAGSLKTRRRVNF